MNASKSISSLPAVPKEKAQKMAKLTEQQLSELQEITYKAIAHYTGPAHALESAIGALNMGYHVGWKVLYMFHDKKTIRKYEEILGVNFREYFNETGPGSNRSLGFMATEKLKKFWNVVNGEIKVDHKKEISA